MKNVLLPVLLWAIAFVQVSGQKTLPPSFLPYAANLDYKLVKAFHQMGFDMPTMANATPASKAQPRFNAPLQLDSTKTFYGFLAGTSDSTPLSRSIYQYPFDDIKIELNAQFENGEWRKISRVTYISDLQGRLIEVIGEGFDQNTQEYVPDSRLEGFPHGNSATEIDSFFVYQWNDAIQEWIIQISEVNHFDSQDRLSESITALYNLGGSIILKDVYTYDANGDNILIESFAALDGAEFPAGQVELEYQNHLVKVVISSTPLEDGTYQQDTKTTYDYTPFGKEAFINTYNWDFETDGWAQAQEEQFTYDNSQRLSSRQITFLNPDGNPEKERNTYEYFQDENLAVESSFYWDGVAFMLNERKHYYYSDGVSRADEPKNVSSPLMASPNPTTGATRLNLTEPAVVQIYNTHGQMISSAEYQPDNTLNLAALPSGLYFITAHSAQQAYSGRLVKE